MHKQVALENQTIMKKLFILFVILSSFGAIAQSVGINADGSAANSSAMLDVSSTTKGFLPPRMTTIQRDAISSAATGLVIFNTTTNSLEVKSNSSWESLSSANGINYPGFFIGSQYWMDKNLEVTNYRNGEIIPYEPDATKWATLTTGAWCYYKNDPSSGYGKLYNWYAVNDTRGLAPRGWHIPTFDEWTALGNYLGGNAGSKMKTTGTKSWASPNTNATNESAFAALPGGYRLGTGLWFSTFVGGHWWSSTGYFGNGNQGNSYSVYLGDFSDSLLLDYSDMKGGMSVRCIRD